MTAALSALLAAVKQILGSIEGVIIRAAMTVPVIARRTKAVNFMIIVDTVGGFDRAEHHSPDYSLAFIVFFHTPYLLEFVKR